MLTAFPDTAHLRTTAEFVRDQDTASLLALLLPGLDGSELRSLTERCCFTHAAVLVFPPDWDTLHAELAACDLAADADPAPSVVVKERLAARHRRDPATLDVRILRPPVRGRGGESRMVEVFALPVPPGSGLAEVADVERARQHEAHVAFDVDRADPLLLSGLRTILIRHGATPDGGGYNVHENGTVFYFATPPDSTSGYRRMELYASGDFRDVLAVHLAEQRADQDAATLLRLMTGAWTTQALAAFAELGVPDALDTEFGTELEVLAKQTGLHADSLNRLLRYLAMMGVVRRDAGSGGDSAGGWDGDGGDSDGGSSDDCADGGDGGGIGGSWRLTGLGSLLRADDSHSMRSLALMYAGTFYQSFTGLAHTVRTGRDGFEHVFGTHHFEHFGRHPGLTDLFQQSMAASALMFDPVPDHPAFAAAVEHAAARKRPATVVDVAGGTGALLGRILTAHPTLHGALLERPHVVPAAREALRAAGCADRCEYHVGDFADVPSGADVYLLSRVLHDWDDERCREILRHCAKAMPQHADLLVLERVLPVGTVPSLAGSWDLHMLCNVGGRERHTGHYARLLADAGLELVAHSPLPLEGRLLHARKMSGA
ncbi:hypothetical protein ABH935_001413 [Catenulispora sp. GAS73]|uniref:methyltransferase n=1 Tax=Catenulispora sp. GAS73 TaxID=3156269 RepID=UPI0035132DC1